MVSNYVQFLARRYRGKLDSDADDFINYAVEGAARMKTLIDDLLQYSRISSRGKAPELSNSGAVLDQTLADLKRLIEETHAEVTRDPLPEVSVDASQLRQVFQNLIANAIAFRRDEPPKVHVSARRDGRDWIFSVSDNGIGIEAKYFDRIFVIFQRLHTREKYPGTGLGLALCKKIVERHGGRMWIESEPGVGSTFYFSIPVGEEKQADSAA